MPFGLALGNLRGLPENLVVSSLTTLLLALSSPSDQMPSLFSRARTNSSTNRKNLPPSGDNFFSSFDEFGRTSSRLSNNRVFGTPSKKEKKAKENSKRGKKLSPGQQDSEDPPEPVFPDGAFLPLNLERPRNGEPYRKC